MHVYQIRSQTIPSQYYTGITTELDHRLADHNAGKSPHTSKYAPWTLVASVYIPDREKAYAFEKYLKSGSGRAFSTRHFR